MTVVKEISKYKLGIVGVQEVRSASIKCWEGLE
jgi:hypothetical protein